MFVPVPAFRVHKFSQAQPSHGEVETVSVDFVIFLASLRRVDSLGSLNLPFFLVPPPLMHMVR